MIPQPTASQIQTTQSALRSLAPARYRFSTAGIRNHVSIRVLIVTSFVVPIITAVGLTGWLSIRNGQQAINEMSGRLQTEVGDRISAHLDTYLSTPHQLNQINLDGVELGLLHLQDFKSLGKYFWRQMKVFNIGYNNFANRNGEFIGVERLDDGNLLINEVSNASTQGKLYVYQTDKQGNRTTLEDTKTYDPRTEAWYADAARVRHPLWSQIYQWEDKPDILSISSSYPVYDKDENFVGVIGIDLILSQISQFLNTLNVSPSARIFVVEQNGLIVANSGTSKPYAVKGGKPRRLQAEASADPLIQATARYLKTSAGGAEKIQTRQLLSFDFQGERRLVQVTPWKDQWGLNWRIVIVTSESDFTAQIHANTRNTIVLCSLALLVALLLGLVISRKITEPMIRLSQASQAIASGNLNQTIRVEGFGELRVLAHSFNQMVQQLQQSFTALEAANHDLEQRVAERTATLHEESQALQHEVEHLLDVVSAIEHGDLTVEAQVSPRVTGLVGDTLNRLIEQLRQLMTTVIGAAEQVNQGTESLKQSAVTVTGNVQHQFQSVSDVQRLLGAVNEQAEQTTWQATQADQAVQLTQAAIDQGQQEIAAMVQGIQDLRQETDHIVKRTQTLTNYAELAAQFVKDQKRIAAMTRLLAVNASMLANRATAQQDPDQMASITREFETIATQVNQLATQTNQSLTLLQQRTDQIQTVVSGLNYDIQAISQQVNQFTSGVNESQQVFDRIKAISQRVDQLGQRVTQSSQAIVDAAHTSVQSIHTIAALTTETLDRAHLTQEQAQQMEQLAQTLLHRVGFFKLPPDVTPLLPEPNSLSLSVSQNGASSYHRPNSPNRD